MKIVAFATFIAVAGFATMLIIRSIPEIRRYVKISSM